MSSTLYTVVLLAGVLCAALWTNPVSFQFPKQSVFVGHFDDIDSTCRVISRAISSEASVHYPGE